MCNMYQSESEVAQSGPTLCDPMDGNLPGSRSMGFSRQEYLRSPSPGDLPNPGIEPGSPALQTDALPSEPLNNNINAFKVVGLKLMMEVEQFIIQKELKECYLLP